MYIFKALESNLTYISLLFFIFILFITAVIFEIPQILFLWQLLNSGSFKYDKTVLV